MTRKLAGSKLLSVTTVAVLLVAQTWAAVGGPDLPDPGSAPISREDQIKLGYQAAAQVYKQMPVLPDNSPETQYVRQLGEKLLAQIPQQYSWPFEFHVIAQKEINAFALPGGPMFVNVGTITAAANEAQLAGVMAHEMSHVYMMHSAKAAGKQQTTAILGGLIGALAGAALGGVVGQLAQAGIQFGAQGLVLRYSRADEAQADAVGAIIMYKAGYDPQALADFFKTLESQGGSPPQILSDHPNPGNREQAIQREIAGWPPKRYQTNSTAFERTKQLATDVKSYTSQEIAQGAKNGEWARLNQQNGAVFRAPQGVAVSEPASGPGNGSPTGGPASLESVLPSSRMVTANLGPLTISHPENWRIIEPQQRGASLTIAPQAGISGNGVGYGVVINGGAPQNGQRMNIDQFTNELVRDLEQAGGGLQPEGNAQQIRVAGVQGRSVPLQSTSPFRASNGQPQRERDWLVTVPQPDGSFLYFVFVAPESQFDRFRPTFDRMLESVQF
jgi:Zn-dependent protease with chaperone function